MHSYLVIDTVSRTHTHKLPLPKEMPSYHKGTITASTHGPNEKIALQMDSRWATPQFPHRPHLVEIGTSNYRNEYTHIHTHACVQNVVVVALLLLAPIHFGVIVPKPTPFPFPSCVHQTAHRVPLVIAS